MATSPPFEALMDFFISSLVDVINLSLLRELKRDPNASKNGCGSRNDDWPTMATSLLTLSGSITNLPSRIQGYSQLRCSETH